MKTKLQDLEVASYYLMKPTTGNPIQSVLLERVLSHDNENKWVVRDKGDCLNKQGKFEYEPMPSNRTDAFIKRTRFDKPEEALHAWDNHLILLSEASNDEKKNHVIKNKLEQ